MTVLLQHKHYFSNLFNRYTPWAKDTSLRLIYLEIYVSVNANELHNTNPYRDKLEYSQTGVTF